MHGRFCVQVRWKKSANARDTGWCSGEPTRPVLRFGGVSPTCSDGNVNVDSFFSRTTKICLIYLSPLQFFSFFDFLASCYTLHKVSLFFFLVHLLSRPHYKPDLRGTVFICMYVVELHPLFLFPAPVS